MSKPTIAVIGGTGAEGSGLAVRWAVQGYPILIGSRSADKAVEFSAELTAELPAGSAAISGTTNAAAHQRVRPDAPTRTWSTRQRQAGARLHWACVVRSAEHRGQMRPAPRLDRRRPSTPRFAAAWPLGTLAS